MRLTENKMIISKAMRHRIMIMPQLFVNCDGEINPIIFSIIVIAGKMNDNANL
jgi:hypothetical protein